MAKQRIEKKTETLEVRLPHTKKEAFKEACEAEGITASHAVRTFIDAYLKQSRRVKLKTISQEITMKLFRNPLKTAAAIGTSLTAAVLFAASPSVADPDTFALMDKNGDGFITNADIQNDSDTLDPALAHADSNKDGKLDRAEFATLNTVHLEMGAGVALGENAGSQLVFIAADGDDAALGDKKVTTIEWQPNDGGERQTLTFKPATPSED